MTNSPKNGIHQFDYLRLFGLKGRNFKHELLIAESKGLKSSNISTFCKNAGLSLDEIATLLHISRNQLNKKMRKGSFSAREADILLNVGKIVYEFFRLYPDIQDFWLLFLAGREDLHGRSCLDLSITEIGRGRVLAQIHKERDDYFKEISKENKSHKHAKTKNRKRKAVGKVIEDPRELTAEEEVYRFVKKHPHE
jgi:transcriptional regulator with XRE-family HTH domain